MFENEDYILRDDLTGADETTAIEIVSDTIWKGVIYRYDAVSFVEDPNTGKANMRFSFKIIDDLAQFTEDELRADTGFIHYIGTILNALILQYVSIPEEAFVESEENEL
jgi:hypothetical protein